jgi:hypothetical protein
MEDTKDLTKKWLQLSAQFEMFLVSNKTQTSLRQLLQHVNQFPFMYDPHVEDVTGRMNLLPKIIQKYLKSYNVSILDDIIDQHRNKQLSNVTQQDIFNYLEEHNKTGWLHVETVREHLKKGIEMMIMKKTGKQSTTDHNIELIGELKKIDYMAKGWQMVLKPMKLDLFYGFPNETMMNRYIANRTDNGKPQKPLLSAIVFDNIEKDGKLPKHIQYRIRMDSRILFSTASVRSRYWVPGPLAGNAKYYYFGFAWMQDQLERAMIELLTGRNVTQPGIYIQEMPYPCFLKDK